MKFAFLGYSQEKNWDTMSKNEQDAMLEDCFTYDHHLLREGRVIAEGGALQASQTAKTLRWHKGAVIVTDGPYAETKEQLGGVGVLEASDMGQAVELISKHPGLHYGATFEIRPIDEASHMRQAKSLAALRPGAPAECSTVTREIAVAGAEPPKPQATGGSLWPIRNSWNRATESLYSTWIAKLFDAPPDVDLSWKAWHGVLHDRSRNLLFDYMGLNEDNVALSLRPDCADFVYFLRAYFAYKLGLPFGYSNCSRGAGGAPPKCYQWFDIVHPEVTRPARPPEQTASAITEALQLAAPPAPRRPSGRPVRGRSAPPAGRLPRTRWSADAASLRP